MKRIVIFALIVIAAGFIACKKEQGTPKKQQTPTGPKTLLGNWKHIGNMISIGGPMYFVPTNDNNNVEFTTNNTMAGSAFPGYIYYTIQDSTTLRLTKQDNQTYEDYFFKLNEDTLTMSDKTHICIEGCAIKFVREGD